MIEQDRVRRLAQFHRLAQVDQRFLRPVQAEEHPTQTVQVSGVFGAIHRNGCYGDARRHLDRGMECVNAVERP